MLEAMEKIHLENQQLKERIELLNSQLVSEYKRAEELQAKIDKANKILSEILVIKQGNEYRPVKNTTKQDVYKTIIDLNIILDTPDRAKGEDYQSSNQYYQDLKTMKEYYERENNE